MASKSKNKIQKHERTTRRNPCRACGKDHWCLNLDHMTVCTELESEYWEEGLGGWLHPLPGQSFAKTGTGDIVKRERPRPPERMKRAGLVKRDQVYKKLLSMLTLIEEHLEHLQSSKRGMSLDQINERGYRTAFEPWEDGLREPSQNLQGRAIASELGSEFGEITNVPGFGVNKKGELVASYITAPKILIPIRSECGRIQGFQMHDPSPDCDKRKRYVWMSAVGELGASVGTPLHVARPVGEVKGPTVIITEGPLKADIVSNMTGLVTIAFQGVNCIDWDALDTLLDILGNEKVVVALDADWKTNKDVKRAHQKLCAFLVDIGVQYQLADWDEADGKGLDDLLLAGHKPHFHKPTTELEPTEEDQDEGRQFVERSFICASWSDSNRSKVLCTFPEERFRDPASREARRAIKRMLEKGVDIDPIGVGNEMRNDQQFGLWNGLNRFYSQNAAHLVKANISSYQAFKSELVRDDMEELLQNHLETCRTGDSQERLSSLFKDISTLVAESDIQEDLKTLKEHMIEYLDELDSGDIEKRQIRIRAMYDVVGNFGGGDVLFFCGPAKIGKSGILSKILREAAKDGYKCLLGQLELRPDQVCEREGTVYFGKPLNKMQKGERQILRREGVIDFLDNIYLTTKATDINQYESEVTAFLAKHPDIKIWATDYDEMLHKIDGKNDRLNMAEAVPSMIKRVAKAFDILGICLFQPNMKYFSECLKLNKPQLHHWKRGGKAQQDAQCAVFIHKPGKFNSDVPEEYLELHVQLSRSSGTGVIPLRNNAENYSYTRWEGPIPPGAGTLDDQTAAQKYAVDGKPMAPVNLDLYEDIEF